METNFSAPVIYALSDGRAGNVAMALGLAERVAFASGGSVERYDVAVSGGLSVLPPWLLCRFPSVSRATIKEMHLASETLPDLVIGAGRRVATVVAALRRPGTKVVQILGPQMPLDRFDLVVAPSHDRLRAPNVFATLGSVGGVTPRVLDAARARWAWQFEAFRPPLVTVSVGGDTKRRTVPEATWRAVAADLARLSETASLIVTTSRRTPARGAAILREALPDAWFGADKGGENPYLGMLACADAVLVTDDSVNMASEAASTGKPVALYPLLREGGKTARFHEALIAAGHAAWFDGSIPTASAGPLDETGRAAEAVVGLL